MIAELTNPATNASFKGKSLFSGRGLICKLLRNLYPADDHHIKNEFETAYLIYKSVLKKSVIDFRNNKTPN